jgi:hypothetical protein
MGCNLFLCRPIKYNNVTVGSSEEKTLPIRLVKRRERDRTPTSTLNNRGWLFTTDWKEISNNNA